MILIAEILISIKKQVQSKILDMLTSIKGRVLELEADPEFVCGEIKNWE